MIVTEAGTEDLPAVAALVNLAYRGEAAQQSWTSEGGFIAGQRTNVALLREDLDGQPHRCVLLARADGNGPLLGCVMLDASEPGTCYLGMLSVSPDAQNTGLGKRLIAAAEGWARGRDATRLKITVIQVRGPLIAWYERHGFVRTGETEPFPYDDQRFGVPLRDDLHFVVLTKAIAPGEPAT